MTTFSDLFKRALIFITASILSLIIFVGQLFGYLSYPFALLPLIGYMVILKKMKDKKRVSSLLKGELAKLNYVILEERPLTIREQYENYELDFGFNYLKGINTNSWLYKAKLLRHLYKV